MPGAFLTRISKAWPAELENQFTSNGVLKRVGEPEEIVGAAIYLASDQSSFTTGTVLRVDGGLPLCPLPRAQRSPRASWQRAFSPQCAARTLRRRSPIS